MNQEIKDLCGIDFPNMEWTTWEKPGANGRVKMCFVGNKRFRLLELPPGFNEENWCLKGHIGYVLQGVFTIHYNDRQVICSPGMGFIIPDGDPHRSEGTMEGSTQVFVIDEV